MTLLRAIPWDGKNKSWIVSAFKREWGLGAEGRKGWGETGDICNTSTIKNTFKKEREWEMRMLRQ